MKLSSEQTASIESEILKRVRAHPGISRIALSRELQLAPSTVSNYVSRLITEGFLSESQKTDHDAGRPPTALRLDPNGGQFIGVDFEARNIMAMAVDFSDRPLRHTHRDIEESDSVPQIIEKIEQAVAEVLPTDNSRVLAIGVGVPGVVDPAQGIAIHYKYIRNWKNVSLAAPLAKRFGVPVFLENTVRSMTLAEFWFGQGRGLSDWLCFGIRSGIGTGVVSGGQLQRGSDYRAGEIGRWRCPRPLHGAVRLSGNGTLFPSEGAELQDVASVRALVKALDQARRNTTKTVLGSQPEPLVFADVVRAAQQRDRLTTQIIEVAAEMLGWAVAQLVLALNPSRVILAGPLTLLGDTLLRPLRTRAEQILTATDANVPGIVNSSMGEYCGALGAAALAVHEWKPAR